jgi:uncharacterized protein YqeY
VMALFQLIEKHMIEALKAGEKDRLTVLRGLKSDLKYRQIDKGKDLTEEEVLEVLSSCAKKRRDSIEQFQAGGRDDLVQKEQFDLKVISTYLPEQMGEAEVRQIVVEAIAETGADSPAGIGVVMQAVMPQVKGRADGKLVNQIVRELLVAK